MRKCYITYLYTTQTAKIFITLFFPLRNKILVCYFLPEIRKVCRVHDLETISVGILPDRVRYEHMVENWKTNFVKPTQWSPIKQLWLFWEVFSFFQGEIVWKLLFLMYYHKYQLNFKIGIYTLTSCGKIWFQAVMRSKHILWSHCKKLTESQKIISWLLQ